METYEANWKNYYEILRVSPDAKPKVVTAAYKRLAHLYQDLLSDRAKETEIFPMGMADLTEAYEVLSDPDRRDAYDHLFKAKYGPQEVEAEQPVEEELIDSMTVLSKDMSKRGAKKHRRVPRWVKVAQRAVLIAVVALVFILGGESSYAFAQPESTLATPFKGIAATVAETSSGATTDALLEKIEQLLDQLEQVE